MSDESLVCNACQFSITSAVDRSQHYRSEWHRYNVKRRCAGLLPINATLFNTQLSHLQNATKQTTEPVVKVKRKCGVCSKTFASQSSFDAHLLSKKHIKLEQQLSSSTSTINDNDNDNDSDTNSDNGNGNDSVTVSEEVKDDILADVESKLDDLKVDDADPGTQLDDEEIREYDGYQLQPGENPIPLLHCLFCSSDRQFTTIDDSVSHMHKQHGLFVPFSNYLNSLDALLTYLGEKVGIGHVCVYCNQRFASTVAVQAHMKEKSHCKLRLDTEDDEDEYSDYFDFPETSESGSGSGRRLAGISDNGELLLTDGSTIGHRQYNHIYQQRIHMPAPQPESVALASAAYQQQQYGTSDALVVSSDGSKQLSTNVLVRPSRINRDKDSGPRYRETWIRKNERRLALKVGIRNNIQMHYRAQVQF